MRLCKPVSYLVAALTLTLGLAACDMIQQRETAGEYVDDSAISTRIKSDLLRTRTMQAHKQIHVETFKGTVILSGLVDSRRTADKAIAIAKAVPSVVEVKDAMVIGAEAAQPSQPAQQTPPSRKQLSQPPEPPLPPQ